MGEIIKIFVAVLSVAVVAQDLGYHNLVGIPAASKILKGERTIKPTKLKPEEMIDLELESYYVGVIITLNQTISTCGSSLLSSSRALTAAHCWWDGWQQAKQFTLVFGSEYLFIGGTRLNTEDVQMHEKYNPISLINNLAIIKFADVEFSPNIHPIALPFNLKHVNFIGILVDVSGYGKAMPDSSGHSPPMKELDLTVVVVPTSRCINSTRYFMQRTLCTWSNYHVCIGHSGGPLAAKLNNTRVLIGVSSFGDYTCNHNVINLSGYVAVSFYMDWIYTILAHNKNSTKGYFISYFSHILPILVVRAVSEIQIL